MNAGSLYVLLDSETLFNLGSGSIACNSDITLDSADRGDFYSIIGGKLYHQKFGFYDRTDGESYTVYCWGSNADYFLNYNYLILPATILVCLFFSVIWRWFIRMRG